MKLLILTQVVDKKHSALGFFHGWLEEFANQCEEVTVIALEVGDYNMPDNVTVHSLGKEKGLKKIQYLINFYKLIWQLRKNYDKVFVHMNQVYVILGSVLWKLLNKRVSLWYVHKQVTFSLRVAVLLVDKVFTSSKESLGLKTKKVEYVGHGINLTQYNKLAPKVSNEIFEVSHFGRISRIKSIDVLIKAVANSSYKKLITINLYGEPNTKDDYLYAEEIKSQAEQLSVTLNFFGAVDSDDVPLKLAETDLSVNLTPTGGWDKVILEAMASKTLILTSNNAFREVLSKYKESLIFNFGDSEELSTLIDKQLSLSNEEKLSQLNYLYDQIKKYNLPTLIRKII